MANKNVFRCPAYEVNGATHHYKDVRTALTIGVIQEPTETQSHWRSDTPFSGATLHDSEADAVTFVEVWVDRVENSRY